MPPMNFSISFDRRDIPTVHKYWDEVFASGQWTEGRFTKLFEEKWATFNQLEALAFSGWAGAAAAMLEYYGVRGETVLVPSNTFMATPLSVLNAGGKVQFVDCNREDLCISYDDFVSKARQYKPKAVWVVHIGGHIAFDVERIAAYCKEHNILLFEDCAHAHGAEWNGKRPGQWGAGGVYSFYATKTCALGEGGMLVTKDTGLIEFARKYRNWGKFDYAVQGTNARMNEFTAALGVVQVDRLPDIIAFKRDYARRELDPNYQNRIKFPDGMYSGYYKYIVFEPIEKSTGKVYDQSCHHILKHQIELPNTDWIAQNHWCVPLYYSHETHE